jgi:polysaccharide deacetylase family protein (PEP-CTERM system associated)
MRPTDCEYLQPRVIRHEFTLTNSIRNALTVDVEEWFHANALAEAAPRDRWTTLESRVVMTTRSLLEQFERRKVRGTFFVLGWVAEREPALVREIAAAGHEIACHGYSHKLVFRQTPQEFREETLRAKSTLEQIVGRSVEGYRASTYSITPQSTWALDILADLQFRYDSSIFPIRHDVYGFPGASRIPGLLQTPSGAQLVEFPMTTASVAGINLPICGGGYFRLLPYSLTVHGLRKVNEVERRPFVFYLHPWEVDPGQPRMKVRWTSRLRHYTNLGRTARRLDGLLGQFRFDSMHTVLDDMGLLK